MIIDGLNWGQFTRLPHIVGLPMSEQIRAYDIYNETLIQEALLQQQYYTQEVVVPNTARGGIDLVEEISNDGCIQFIVDTSNSTYNEVNIGVNADTNYTITWGDGTSEEGLLQPETTTLSHSYSENNQQYVTRICFTNPEVVVYLDFPGND